MAEPVAGLGGVPVDEEDLLAVQGAPGGLVPVVPLEIGPPVVDGPGISPASAPAEVDQDPEAEAALVQRSRSMGPRPRLLDRQAAPIEPPDMAAAGNALGQSAISTIGAAVAGVPLAAGSAARGLGRAMATGPAQILAIYDGVDAAEERDGGGGPVGAVADLYRRADAAGRAEMRAAAGQAQVQREEAGTGQGLQAAGQGLQAAGRAVSGAVDSFARDTFPVAPEREGDFAVRSARAAGALPAILGAGAVAGPAGVAGVIGSQTYATTYGQALDTLVASGLPVDQAEARAADAATANAFVQAGLMTVPFVRMLDRMAPAAQREVLGTLRQMALSGAEFSGSNAVGRVLENVLAREGYDADRAIMHEVVESLGPEAFVGAAIPGGAAAARAAGNAGRRASASPEVQAAARGVEDAARAVQEASTEPGQMTTREGDSATLGPEASTEPHQAYQAAVDRFAEATGLPPQVRVRMVDALRAPEGGEIDARYDPAARLIEVAMDTDPALAASRVFHEGGGHVALEFADPRERMALERAADRWLARPLDPALLRPGADLSAPEMAGARTNLDYVARLNRLDLGDQAGRDLAREEAIAHLAEMHLARSLEASPLVARALDRISDGINRLGAALRGHGFVSADSVFRAMTGGGRRNAGPAPAAEGTGVVRNSMRAWHGTPHDFAAEPGHPLGRFDYQRIGTGEGAQAYGHGLYFADARDVAETYQRDLPLHAVEGLRQSIYAVVNAHLFRGGGNIPPALILRNIEERAQAAGGTQARMLRGIGQDPRAMEAIGRILRAHSESDRVRGWRDLDSAVERLAPEGRLYEVDIDADPTRMLDWDAGVDQQPVNVRRALDDIGVRDQRASFGFQDPQAFDNGGVRRRFHEIRDGVPTGLMRGEIVRPGPDPQGWWEVRVGTSPSRMATVMLEASEAGAERALRERLGAREDRAMPGSRGYLLASAHAGSPAAASAALRERGVPGLRFLDGLSRDEGRGTRNTVTFSDDIVRILNRYSRREGSTGVAGTHSALGRAVDGLQERATGRQYLAALRNAQGVKAEEMAWTGLDAMLQEAGNRRVTRAEMQEWLRANDLGLEVVRRGEGPRDDADADARMDAQQQAWTLMEAMFAVVPDGGGGLMVDVPGDRLPREGTPQRVVVDRTMDRLNNERFETEAEARDALDEELREVMPINAADLRDLLPSTRGGGEPVRYAGYQVPGGENYGEALIVLPAGEPGGDYQSSHWAEPNVLAHVRFNEREDGRGRPILFLEELQSDWHQDGRSRGYRGRDAEAVFDHAVQTMDEARGAYYETVGRGVEAEIVPAARRLEEAQQAVRDARNAFAGGVPDAPFKTSWPALIMKRMLAQAVQNGQQAVAWTDGQIQADRWGSGGGGEEARRLVWNPNTGELRGYGGRSSNPSITRSGLTTAAQLREAIGLDAATRLLDAAREWTADAPPAPGPALDRVPAAYRAVMEQEGPAQQIMARKVMEWAVRRQREAEDGMPAALFTVPAELLDPGNQGARHRRERQMHIGDLITEAANSERIAQQMVERGEPDMAAWFVADAMSDRAAVHVLEDAAAGRRSPAPEAADRDPQGAAAYRQLAEWARVRLFGPDNQGAEVTLPDHAPVRLGGRAAGMQGFYDKRLPAEVARLVKPFGGEVRSTVIRTAAGAGGDGAPRHVYSVDITPRMREAVQAGGFPLFSRREDVERAASRAADPSPAQADAGNYRKGHVRLHGMPISIETPRGGMRRGVGPDGVAWEARLPAHYGYVRGTRGRDGDAVDVYLGPEAQDPALPVFVVDQIDAETGRFDEHKALLGFPDEAAALEVYDAAFSDGRGPERRRAVTAMPLARFQRWVRSGAPARGPVARNRDREDRSMRQRAFEGRVGYAEGGVVAQGVAPGPVQALHAPVVAQAPPAPVAGLGGAAAPVPDPAVPNVGAGATDPETRGALQGVEMWRMAASHTGRRAGLW